MFRHASQSEQLEVTVIFRLQKIIPLKKTLSAPDQAVIHNQRID